MCVGLLMQFHDTTVKPIWPSLHPREEQRAGKHSVLSRARSLCCSSPAAWVLLPRGFSASPWALCLLQHSWGSSFMLIAEPCCTALTQNLTGDAQRVMAWLAGVHELSWAGVHKASCGLDGSGGAGARGSAQTSIPWWPSRIRVLGSPAVTAVAPQGNTGPVPCPAELAEPGWQGAQRALQTPEQIKHRKGKTKNNSNRKGSSEKTWALEIWRVLELTD